MATEKKIPGQESSEQIDHDEKKDSQRMSTAGAGGRTDEDTEGDLEEDDESENQSDRGNEQRVSGGEQIDRDVDLGKPQRDKKPQRDDVQQPTWQQQGQQKGQPQKGQEQPGQTNKVPVEKKPEKRP